MTRTTALEWSLASLREQLAELIQADAAVRVGVPDAVHRMRTAVRRLRTTLRAGRRVLDRDHLDPLRDRLAELGAVLEPAREAELRLEALDSLFAERRASRIPVAVRARLAVETRREFRRRRAEVVALFGAGSYARLLTDLDALVVRPPVGDRAFRPAPRRLGRVLGKQTAIALERLEAVDGSLGSWHAARKAVRRVRYVAESMLAVPGAVASGDRAALERLAGVAEDLQDVIGDHRDAEVAALDLAEQALRRRGVNRTALETLARISASRADALRGAHAAERAAFAAAVDAGLNPG